MHSSAQLYKATVKPLYHPQYAELLHVCQCMSIYIYIWICAHYLEQPVGVSGVCVTVQRDGLHTVNAITVGRLLYTAVHCV
jgi:hypothetical protein